MSFVVLRVILPYDKDEPDLILRCALSNAPSWYSKKYFFSKVFAHICILFICSAQISYLALRNIRRRREEQIRDKKSHKEFKEHLRSVKTMVLLLFVFLIFWVPLLVGFTLTASRRGLYFSIAMFWIKFNSSINACVYSLSRESFKFCVMYLMKNKPCAWKNLNKKMMQRKVTKYLEQNSASTISQMFRR